MKNLIILILASLLSPALFAATLTGSEVAYYSDDKITWYEAEISARIEYQQCVAGNLHGCESFKQIREAVIVFNEKPVVEPLYYRLAGSVSPPIDPEPDPDPIPDPTPDPEPSPDPETPSVKCLVNPTNYSGQALRSPSDRMINLMSSADVASAMTTAANIVNDRNDLLPRIDEIRRIIAEVVRCDQLGDK